MTAPVAPPPVLADAEFAERRRRLGEACAERGHAAALAWGRGGALDAFSDVHYLSRHYSPGVWVPPIPGVLTGLEHAALVVGLDGHATLVVTDYAAPDAVVDEIRRGLDLAGTVVDVLRERRLASSSLALLGAEVLPDSIGRRLRADLPDLTLADADDLSATMRFRLSDAEIVMLRHAGAVGRRIYDAVSAQIRPGVTEGEALAAGLEVAATTPGCAHWNFLAASGAHAGAIMHASLPAWLPNYTYREGDTVHPDCYGFVGGYAYDLARTAIVGDDPSPAQAHVISAVERACGIIAGALRPGVTPAELHELAVAHLTRERLQPLVPTGGHGIGAGVFRPLLIPTGPDAGRPLEPPLGLAVEVFARDASGNAAYHEDNYIWAQDGVECVTDPVKSVAG